jgi:hypothetical protein
MYVVLSTTASRKYANSAGDVYPIQRLIQPLQRAGKRMCSQYLPVVMYGNHLRGVAHCFVVKKLHVCT